MTRLRVLPYKQGSESARELSRALNCKRLMVRGSKFNPRAGDTIINWGHSEDHPSLTRHANVLNTPDAIRAASNKHMFFESVYMTDPEVIPEFWSDPRSIPKEAYPIVCRTVLNGHSGKGIVIARNEAELVPAPLYVKYIHKKDEYRVHVGRVSGSLFALLSVQRKARKRDVPDDKVNWMVRNHSNGFIFARNIEEPPLSVIEVAYKAVNAVGLDFGAADVIFNENSKRAYVLEVNTAPGLAGSTVDDYAQYFEGVLRGQQIQEPCG